MSQSQGFMERVHELIAQKEAAQGGKRVDVFLRWMIRLDMPQVLGIESQAADPWIEADFLYYLRQRNVNAFVAELGARILGFFLCEIKPRGFHLLHLMVHSDWRRKGIGRQMIDKLKENLPLAVSKQIRLTRILADVRESNLGGQLFFKSQGFKAVRIIPEFFRNNGESSYFMRYDLPE